MPGIVGIISQKPSEECRYLVRSMMSCMQHESFYECGTYESPTLGAYGGWIALEDSFAARQVFFNEKRDIALLFSGECFLDTGTRSDLKKKGHQVEDNHGDWLVRLYEEEGDRF